MMAHSEDQEFAEAEAIVNVEGPLPGMHEDYYALWKYINYNRTTNKFEKIPFKLDEFEPIISPENLKFHYEVHYASFSENLYEALQKVENTLMDYEDSPKELKNL